MSITISVVVPCHAAHLEYLDTTFNDICNQTVLPCEVILAASEVDDITKQNLKEKFQNLFLDHKIEFKIISTPQIQYAGINRNMGATLAIGDYVMFIDADDTIHSQKIEATIYFLELHKPNVLLHSLVSDKPMDFLKNHNLNYQNAPIIANDQIMIDTFGDPPVRNRQREINRRVGGHSIGLKSKKKFYYIVTHGYATVKRSMFEKYQYTNLKKGEDGVFVRDILWNEGGVMYVIMPLLNYRPIRCKV